MRYKQQDDYSGGKQRDAASNQNQQLESASLCSRFGPGDAEEGQRRPEPVLLAWLISHGELDASLTEQRPSTDARGPAFVADLLRSDACVLLRFVQFIAPHIEEPIQASPKIFKSDLCAQLEQLLFRKFLAQASVEIVRDIRRRLRQRVGQFDQQPLNIGEHAQIIACQRQQLLVA